MMYKANELRHVGYLRNDEVAVALGEADRLRYRSNLLGADPLTGQPVDVMWVKGSGGDLRTANRSSFAALYLDKLLALHTDYHLAGEEGPKTQIEDAMVELYRRCVFDLDPAASSIDTPLHGLIPFRHVDHMHLISVIAIAASKDQERLAREVFGDEVGWSS